MNWDHLVLNHGYGGLFLLSFFKNIFWIVHEFFSFKIMNNQVVTNVYTYSPWIIFK